MFVLRLCVRVRDLLFCVRGDPNLREPAIFVLCWCNGDRLCVCLCDGDLPERLCVCDGDLPCVCDGDLPDCVCVTVTSRIVCVMVTSRSLPCFSCVSDGHDQEGLMRVRVGQVTNEWGGLGTGGHDHDWWG